MHASDGWPIREVYIDESSQTKHRYLVLGALTVPGARQSMLCDAIRASRLPELPSGELGWVKVSRTKLPAYMRVVDCFFDQTKHHDVHLHSLVVDTTKLKDRLFNQGSREIGFSKEIYQLALKCLRVYPGDVFHVYPDRRGAKRPTEELRTIMNFGSRKNRKEIRPWPFRRVQFRDSAACDAIQVVDILIGALAYRLNGHDKAPDASPAKIDLCNHVLRRAGCANVLYDLRGTGKFTIWHRQLKR